MNDHSIRFTMVSDRGGPAVKVNTSLGFSFFLDVPMRGINIASPCCGERVKSANSFTEGVRLQCLACEKLFSHEAIPTLAYYSTPLVKPELFYPFVEAHCKNVFEAVVLTELLHQRLSLFLLSLTSLMNTLWDPLRDIVREPGLELCSAHSGLL